MDDNSEFEPELADGPSHQPVTPNTKAQNVAGLFSNPKTRNVIIVTLVVLGIIAVLVMLSVNNASKTKEIPEELKGANAGAAPTGMQSDKLATDSPRFVEMAKGIDQVKSAQAEATGGSYQPSATIAYEFKPTAEQQQAAGSQANQRVDPTKHQDEREWVSPQQAEQMRQQQAQTLAQIKQEGIAAAQRNIGLWDRPRGPKMLYFENNQQAGSTVQVAAATGPGTQSGAAGQSQSPQSLTVVASGWRGVMLVELPLSSDEPTSPAVATLLTGPYKESTLVGTFIKNKGNSLRMNLTSMSIPGIGTIPIQASSFNMDDANRQGIATDVDRHIWEKYILKPGSQAVAAVGRVISQPQTIVTVNGNATIPPKLSGRDLAGVAAGGAATQVAQDISAMDIENTVSVAGKTLVGIVFTQDAIYTKQPAQGQSQAMNQTTNVARQ